VGDPHEVAAGQDGHEDGEARDRHGNARELQRRKTVTHTQSLTLAG
jgi:hypothetical protein